MNQYVLLLISRSGCIHCDNFLNNEFARLKKELKEMHITLKHIHLTWDHRELPIELSKYNRWNPMFILFPISEWTQTYKIGNDDNTGESISSIVPRGYVFNIDSNISTFPIVPDRILPDRQNSMANTTANIIRFIKLSIEKYEKYRGEKPTEKLVEKKKETPVATNARIFNIRSKGYVSR